MVGTAVLDWMVQDGERLATCRHDHPCSVLGPQPCDGGWTVRVWMPEASSVTLLDGGRELPMHTPHHPWVFEADPEHDPGSSYRVRVERGGITHEQHDPWAFREEWMGEMDRHLFAEGNHHHIWQRMGAHLTQIDGVSGVMFCLWAPNALSVSVLGNLNSWDGRHHPMQQRLGGIWELFIPGLSAKGLSTNTRSAPRRGTATRRRIPTASSTRSVRTTAPWWPDSTATPGPTPPGCSSGTAAEGIGVIIDWVPGHFPKDAHGLAFFDGTHLYEHSDPRIGEHKEWGTLIFNYSRNEVRNFLVANLVFWFEQFHIDGIRVDAVASMLYRDYLRPDGEWLPNENGGRENTEAVRFLQQANHVLFQHFPGALSIAEESTTWPMVTQPTDSGGLGFNLKWNMGWMHDMLDYFELDPWFRQFHQNNITFSIWYTYTENFMLALSHDEVVHGKSHLLHKMPGDDWQKYANTRALLSYMWTHPGKKTIFMGMEFGQRAEWNVWGDLQWDLLNYEPHKGIQRLVDDLNVLYKAEPALWRDDFDQFGFQWIDCNDNRHSVISFMRRESASGTWLVVVANFTPQSHSHYRVGVPLSGFYEEIFNSDAAKYGGSNLGNMGGKPTDEWGIHGYENSLDLCLPPLSLMVFKHDPKRSLSSSEPDNIV